MYTHWSVIVGVALITILLCLIPNGQALSCYHCNTTFMGKSCGDPFDPKKAETYKKECEDPVNHKFCRKIYQFVGDELRIFRGCGKEKHEKHDCYHTVSEFFKTSVCQCLTDDCNASTTLKSPTVITVIFTVAAILGLFHFL